MAGSVSGIYWSMSGAALLIAGIVEGAYEGGRKRDDE
jgi:hypothetical protein